MIWKCFNQIEDELKLLEVLPFKLEYICSGAQFNSQVCPQRVQGQPQAREQGRERTRATRGGLQRTHGGGSKVGEIKQIGGKIGSYAF